MRLCRSCRAASPSKGRTPFLLFAVVVCAISLTSCGKEGPPEAYPKNPPSARPSRALARGRALYDQYCAPCHGKTGSGDGRYVATGLEPRPADLTRIGSDALDHKELESWIRQGSAGFKRSALCPAWEHTLASDDIQSLAQVVRSLRKETGESKDAKQ